MSTLLANAWSGWQNFITPGKLPAILLALLVFLLLRSSKGREQNTLIHYTAFVTALCILPLTASLFLLYQTRFYDYEWIWSLVPMTGLIGYGAVLFCEECLGKLADRSKWVRIGFCAALCFVLVLCSGFGLWSEELTGEARAREQADRVYAFLRESFGEEDICLWAPKEILQYARALDADCYPLYGRNLWDEHLNAYTYDVYPEEQKQLQLWMDGGYLARGDWSEEQCAAYLSGTDVNCVLLPVRLETSVECFEKALGTTADRFGEYFILIRYGWSAL